MNNRRVGNKVTDVDARFVQSQMNPKTKKQKSKPKTPQIKKVRLKDFPSYSIICIIIVY